MNPSMIDTCFGEERASYIIRAFSRPHGMRQMRSKWLPVAAGGVGLLIATGVLAQQPSSADRPTRLEVWDLKLGTPVASLPDAFDEYACGTNGGPPSVPLRGWGDFQRCRPEPSGLREVYFRYDDELEYWAKANDYATEIARYSGTKVYDFPVVLSALFNDSGILAGLRIVSDPRDRTRDRDEAYTLRNFLTARFGRDGWTCTDNPPGDGEEPVGRTFIKQDCRKTIGEGAETASLQTRYLRKKGQNQFDPHSGKEIADQFESTVHFELTLAR
jgi:hypothetical protein